MRGETDHDWWLQEVSSERTCGVGCGSLRPEYYGESVDILFTKLPSEAISASPLAEALKSSLFALLEPHLRHYVVGRCIHSKTRSVMEDYVSVYTPAYASIYMRGGRGSKYRICQYCKLPHLKGDGTASQVRYILRSQLIGNRHAYQLLGHDYIMITPWLRDQIDWSPYPEIEFLPYPILDEPLDGMDFEIEKLRPKD
jgi:hypothetical protein